MNGIGNMFLHCSFHRKQTQIWGEAVSFCEKAIVVLDFYRGLKLPKSKLLLLLCFAKGFCAASHLQQRCTFQINLAHTPAETNTPTQEEQGGRKDCRREHTDSSAPQQKKKRKEEEKQEALPSEVSLSKTLNPYSCVWPVWSAGQTGKGEFPSWGSNITL